MKNSPRLVARRPIIETTDTDGRAIVRVPLPNGQHAKLLRRHWEKLQRMGIGPNWYLNRAGTGQYYVRTVVPAAFGWGNLAQVSRLIACPGKAGAIVRHIDHDPLNLRLDNLKVISSKTHAKAREQFLPDDAERSAVA